MMLALAGCKSLSGSAEGERSLPAKPDQPFTRQVALPSIAAGVNPMTLAGACLIKLDTANGRIDASWDWYEQLRAVYAMGP